jgi:hypothetical protein
MPFAPEALALVTPHRNSRVQQRSSTCADGLEIFLPAVLYEVVMLPARNLPGTPLSTAHRGYSGRVPRQDRTRAHGSGGGCCDLANLSHLPACTRSLAPQMAKIIPRIFGIMAVRGRRPSAFQAGHIPSWLESCECYALLAVTAACRWSLLLLSPVATGRAASDGSYPSSEALDDGYLSLPAACSLSARAASSPRPWSLCAAPPPPSD